MAGEPIITLVGNITDDPELRFTPSGAAVANFTIASTPRTLDKTTQEWVDGEAMFIRCSVWRQYAENVAESLQKGARVIAQGRLKARSWEDRDGNKRTSFEMDVEEVGPSLRWATAKVIRPQRQSGDQQQGQRGHAPPQNDPWATGGGGGNPQDPWATGGGSSDEPPF